MKKPRQIHSINSKEDARALEACFEYLHNNSPKMFNLFNPDYDKDVAKVWPRVSESMEEDGFYKNHTREECKAEWARRYDLFMAEHKNKHTKT